MDEKSIHPDILIALVQGEIIGGELIPELAEDLFQWYLDTFADVPEIVAILKENEEKFRAAIQAHYTSFAVADSEALLQK